MTLLKTFSRKNKVFLSLVLVLIVFAGGVFYWRSAMSGWIGKKAIPLVQTKKTLYPTQSTKVLLEQVQLEVPEGAVSKETDITVQKIPSAQAPTLAKETSAASDYYEFEPDGLTFAEGKVVSITLDYDPTGLTEEQLETLHIATYQNGEWVPLEGSITNTSQNTVSAPITHFSGFLVRFFETVSAAGEAILYDVIVGKTKFYELPNDLQTTLQADYNPASIKSAIHWKVSHASKTASATIAAANIISSVTDFALTIADLATSALDEGEEALEYAIGILAAEMIGEEALSQAAGEEVGSVVFTLYEAGKIGKEVFKDGAKVFKKADKLQVEIAAFILRKELEYINANVWKGIADLWKLNPTSAKRLQVYVITVEGENKRTGLFDKGVKYFYLDESAGEYTSYQNTYISRKIEFEAAAIPTPNSTPKPTSTPTLKVSPTATPKPATTPTSTTAAAPTTAPTATPTTAPTATPTTAATEEKQSSGGNIAAFAENWSWSKTRNQDGKYGETSVTLGLGGKTVQSATLSVSGSYSQQAGSASSTIYMSISQQVTPTDSDHDKGGYWYGNSISAGTQVGTFSCTYSGATSSYDITSFLQQNSSAGTFYIAVQNNATADIGISSIQIRATLQ